MKLTADDLAQEIRQHHKYWPTMTDTAQAATILPFIENHIAGQQGAEDGMPHTDETVDAMQDKMAELGFAVPVRVISEAVRHATALATRSPPPAKPAGLMLIDTAVAAHIASQMCGPRYGIDWVYYCDKRGRLSEREAFAQPAKPAGAVPLARYSFPHGIQDGTPLQPMSDGYWTPWHVADLVIAGLRKERDAREAAAGGVQIPEAVCYPPCATNGVWHWRIVGVPTGAATVVNEEYARGWNAAREAQPIPQQPAAEGTCRWRCSEASECDGSCAPVAVTAEPAVEAFGTVGGYSSFHRTIAIWLDSELPRRMIFDKTRVTISQPGGKSDA